jgi:hypothetical protein
MTTKQTAVKTVKPAAAFNPKLAAQQVAQYNAQGDSFTAKANETAQALHKYCKKAKIKIGTMKSECVIMASFVAEASKSYTDQVLANICTAFRKAVNEGVDFSQNPYRKKGAKTTKSAESAAVVKLTIVKDSDINEVAQGLREALEGKRDQYAELVAFLIDALDEFEGV